MVPMMLPCTYIQNQLFTLRSLGTARELFQDFIINVGAYKTHPRREVIYSHGA